jgi:predicted nucleic acid-binding protein
MNVVDSSGWIEFFQAGGNGPIFRPVIADETQLIVPTISFFEVHRVLSRHLKESLVTPCLDVMRRGKVVDFTDARAVAASRISKQHHLALADAAMYSIALEFKATFWTQDADYQGLPSVRYFAKSIASP